MLELDRYVATIEELLAQGTASGLTYAALECRLAIEYICYERLRLCLDYISIDELKKWQPKDVVNFLTSEVDPHIAETMSISIADEPTSHELDQPGFEKLNYKLIGTQKGINTNKLGRLWNGLSNAALHTKLPASRNNTTAHYGDPAAIKRQIDKCLVEFKDIIQGNLIMTSPVEQVSFTCSCGQKIKRRIIARDEKQIFHCNSASCLETYSLEREGGEIYFKPRRISVLCQRCEYTQIIPKKMAEDIHINQHIYFDCKSCGDRIFVHWKLMQAQKETTAKAE